MRAHFPSSSKDYIFNTSLAFGYLFFFTFSFGRYTMFWVLLIATKLTFSYYIEVHVSLILISDNH